MMLDRRQFLTAAAGGTVSILASASGSGADHDAASDAPDLARPELLLALGPSAVREIGEAYRALVPVESDRASLETALHAEHRAAHSANADPVRADFAAGRVIVVRDWVLSRTEARQCALFSLRPA